MTQNNESLEKSKQLVNDLYDFRDNYFNDFDNDLNGLKNKRIDVNNKLEANFAFNHFVSHFKQLILLTIGSVKKFG